MKLGVLSAALLACILQLSVAAASSKIVQAKIFCSPDFTLIHGNCYYFSQEITNSWDEAMSLCQQLDQRAMLANFETATEWKFLKTYLVEEQLNDKYWWIGGSDRDSEGHWTWVGSNKPLAYASAWCPGQPDNFEGKENCLNIREGSNPLCWNDFPCTLSGWQLNYICEI